MFRLLAPRFWVLHVAMVVALVAGGLLGYWQLHVWERHQHASSNKVAHEPARPLLKVLGPDAPLQFTDTKNVFIAIREEP